jgi:tripartite-type tricarboxylate transporter receptor subunit TctC
MDRLSSSLRVWAPLLLAAGIAVPAYAQQKSDPVGSYPARTVRVLVGNAPGGGIDITARVVSQKLTERLGRSFVVDNRPGASGVIAMDLTAKAPPDGHVLLVTSGSLIGSAGAQKKVGYDVRTAFAPVSQLTSLCYMLLINPALPVKSVKDLVALAKRKPGELNYGSSGVGGAGHLAGELFASSAGIKMVHVPYKGGGLVLADMIVGQIQLGFTSTISGMPHVRSGKLKALAVTSPKRSQALPEFPTVSESGVPGFELVNWYGLFAPAGTPATIVSALHQNVSQILGMKDIESAFAKDGADAAPSASPADFVTVLAKEVARWDKIVRLPAFAEHLR